MFLGGIIPAFSRGMLLLAISMLAVKGVAAQKPDGPGLFASNCAGCHGSDGRGGEHAPNIANAPEVQHLSDAELTGILNKGIAGAGMPAFSWLGEEKVLAVVAHLRTLQGHGERAAVPGDPVKGERLFYGKARCAECHMVNGKGGFIGSELSFYGADAVPAQIRGIILNPARNLPPSEQLFTITSKSGLTYSGMLRSEDNFSLTLQLQDGSFRYLSKAELTKVERGSHPLMPTDYGTLLTASEIDDLVSYLVHSGAEAVKHSGVRESTSKDDED